MVGLQRKDKALAGHVPSGFINLVATSRPLLPLPMAMVHRLHALSWDTAVLSPIFPGSVTSNNAFACIWTSFDSIRWTRNGIEANSISQDRHVERVKGLHCNTSSSGSGCFWRLSCNYNAVFVEHSARPPRSFRIVTPKRVRHYKQARARKTILQCAEHSTIHHFHRSNRTFRARVL